MNKIQETKEKSCIFYVSDYHFEMISLPYISKKLEEKKQVIIFTEDNLEKTVEKLILKINLKEEKKKQLLEINWKNGDNNKLENIERSIKEGKNIVVFIKGKQNYISKINSNIEKMAKDYNNIKIIDCYNLEETENYLTEIMGKYNNVIGTVGEKSI